MDLRQTITKLSGKRGLETEREPRSLHYDRQGVVASDSGDDSAFGSPRRRDRDSMPPTATNRTALPVRNSQSGSSKRPRTEPRQLFPSANATEDDISSAIRAVQTSVVGLKKRFDQEKAEIEAIEKELARKKESYGMLGDALHRAKITMEQITSSITLNTPPIQQACSAVTSPSVRVAPKHTQLSSPTAVVVKRECGLLPEPSLGDHPRTGAPVR